MIVCSKKNSKAFDGTRANEKSGFRCCQYNENTNFGIVQIHLHGVSQVDHLSARNCRVCGAQESGGACLAVVMASQHKPSRCVGVKRGDDVVEGNLSDNGIRLDKRIEFDVPPQTLHLTDDELKR